MKNIHCINLFEGATLAFDDKEVHDCHSDEEACCENVAVSEIDVTNDEWGEESEQEIPTPCQIMKSVSCTRSVTVDVSTYSWTQSTLPLRLNDIERGTFRHKSSK